jgi:HAD superfamily PSPase-like hydrolase
MVKKVFFSDLDGTLIEIDSAWGTLHKHFEVNPSKNLKAFFDEKISYSEWMALDINLWLEKQGRVHYDELVKAFSNWKYVKNAKNARGFVPIVQSKGYDFVIVSGGFDFLAEEVGKQLGANAAYANGLELDGDGYLTGDGICRVRLGEKYKIVNRYCESVGADPQDCVALTDAYDIDLLKAVGTGIVIGRGDDKLREVANVVIEEKDLMEVLNHI